MSDPDWPYLICRTCKVEHDCPNKSGKMVQSLLDARELLKQLRQVVPDLELETWRDRTLVWFVVEHSDHDLVIE